MAFNVGIYEDIKYCFYPAEKMSIHPIQWNRADSRFAPSQWEMALQSNDVSHWLGASLESALNVMRQHYGSKHTFSVHFLHNGCCFTLFFFYHFTLSLSFANLLPWWRHQMETFSVSPVNSLHKGQWHGALMFSLICAWINGWVNNHKAGDLRRHCVHYDVPVMLTKHLTGPDLSTFLHHDIFKTFKYEQSGTFCRQPFQIHFSEWKILCFDGFAPSRWKAITLASVDPDVWWYMASLSHNAVHNL